MTKLKLIFFGCAAMAFTGAAQASDFGCQALLCFAGGKNVTECAPTIKKVLKDMAKGKAFPHCAMSGGSNAAGDNVTTRTFSELSSKPICRDGQTRGKRVGFGHTYSCRTIEININPQYAIDANHKQQYFNY